MTITVLVLGYLLVGVLIAMYSELHYGDGGVSILLLWPVFMLSFMMFLLVLAHTRTCQALHRSSSKKGA